jgi:hypothetical protein
MARVRAQVVHDELGRIISIARPAQDVKVVISGSNGQAVLETEVDEDMIAGMVSGSHRVDAQAQAIVTNDAPESKSS